MKKKFSTVFSMQQKHITEQNVKNIKFFIHVYLLITYLWCHIKQIKN